MLPGFCTGCHYLLTALAHKTHLLAALLGAFLLIAAGCAPAAETRRSSRSPITAAEIQEARITTSAFDAVRRLRPEWLVIRGQSDIADRPPDRTGGVYGANDDIRVYVDGQRYGYTAEALHTISVQGVRRIQRMTAREATARFGAGHFSGAFSIELN